MAVGWVDLTDSLSLPLWVSTVFWPQAMSFKGPCCALQGQSLFVPHIAWCTPAQPALIHHMGTRALFQKFLQTHRSTNTMSSCEGHRARQPGGEDAGHALRRLESS